MPAADLGSEKVADLDESSDEVKSRRMIRAPPLSKAKTESDESEDSHDSALAEASKNARVSASSAPVSVMAIRAPSEVSGSAGLIVPLSLSHEANRAAAMAAAAKESFLSCNKKLSE